MILEASSLLSQSEVTLAADIGGETAVVDIDRGQYFGFDEIGSEIWRALDPPIRCDALCALIADAFEGDAAIITRDTMAFVEKLVERGLVIVS